MRVSRQMKWVSQAAKPVCLFALVVCLLLSQALGLMHGIEHAPHLHQRDHLHEAQSVEAASDSRTNWIDHLFAGHSEESTCQVFDQLSQGSALLGHSVDNAQLTLTSFFLATYRGATPAYWRSLVQARGPPAVFTVI